MAGQTEPLCSQELQRIPNSPQIFQLAYKRCALGRLKDWQVLGWIEFDGLPHVISQQVATNKPEIDLLAKLGDVGGFDICRQISDPGDEVFGFKPMKDFGFKKLDGLPLLLGKHC